MMTADAESFHVSSTLDAFEGDAPVHRAVHPQRSRATTSDRQSR